MDFRYRICTAYALKMIFVSLNCWYNSHIVKVFFYIFRGGISLKKLSTTHLQPGMILSNEPGYYKEGEYGIRIESLVYVVQLTKPKGFLGFEPLTLVPLEEKLIEDTLLTEKEKKWVKAHQERVSNYL